jgi:CO dehydrogenase/acetyl-CoA synthase beta subunit
MSIFNACIKQTAKYIDEMRKAGREIIEFTCTDHSCNPPFDVGPGSGSGLVMKSDTFLELGSPTAGSCAFALYTKDTSLIRDGRVSLIGPDVQASSSTVLPFGQVIMVGGEAFSTGDYQRLVQCQYTGDLIEGYMVKSMPGRIWTRISNEVAQKGFSFKFLAMALMKIIKAQIPNVTVFEVLFVTSDKSDLQNLNKIGFSVSEIAQALRKKHWETKGVDISDCTFGGDCGSCTDKLVCNAVKKAIYKKKRGGHD